MAVKMHLYNLVLARLYNVSVQAKGDTAVQMCMYKL